MILPCLEPEPEPLSNAQLRHAAEWPGRLAKPAGDFLFLHSAISIDVSIATTTLYPVPRSAGVLKHSGAQRTVLSYFRYSDSLQTSSAGVLGLLTSGA